MDAEIAGPHPRCTTPALQRGGQDSLLGGLLELCPCNEASHPRVHFEKPRREEATSHPDAPTREGALLSPKRTDRWLFSREVPRSSSEETGGREPDQAEAPHQQHRDQHLVELVGRLPAL